VTDKTSAQLQKFPSPAQHSPSPCNQCAEMCSFGRSRTRAPATE